jgi:hypothetical protein
VRASHDLGLDAADVAGYVEEIGALSAGQMMARQAKRVDLSGRDSRRHLGAVERDERIEFAAGRAGID